MKTYCLLDANEQIDGNTQYILVPLKDERVNTYGHITDIFGTTIYEAYGKLTSIYEYPDYSLVTCRTMLEEISEREQSKGKSISEVITDRLLNLKSALYLMNEYIVVNEDSTVWKQEILKTIKLMSEESKEWKYKAV